MISHSQQRPRSRAWAISAAAAFYHSAYPSAAFAAARASARLLVEDFRRGVLLGRADKGLLITTGRFTQEAVLKAANERAPEIRLIDGEELVEKLKELSLGVRTKREVVERVIVEREWFEEV